MTIADFLTTIQRLYSLKNKTETVTFASRLLGITESAIWKWVKTENTPSPQSQIMMSLIIKLTHKYGPEEVLNIYSELD